MFTPALATFLLYSFKAIVSCLSLYSFSVSHVLLAFSSMDSLKIRGEFFNTLYLTWLLLTELVLISEESEDADLRSAVAMVLPFEVTDIPLCGLLSTLYPLYPSAEDPPRLKQLQHLRTSSYIFTVNTPVVRKRKGFVKFLNNSSSQCFCFRLTYLITFTWLKNVCPSLVFSVILPI